MTIEMPAQKNCALYASSHSLTMPDLDLQKCAIVQVCKHVQSAVLILLICTE